ncbi:arylesterase [Vibrio ponticus]|nr:arylesterase [Vibrio ponticus]
MVVIMLGTNDLQSHLGLSAEAISFGAAQLVKQAQHFASHNQDVATNIVLVCPPPIFEIGFAATGFSGGAEKSQQFAEHYQQRAQELGCYYLDAGKWVSSSATEGVHWHEDQPPSLPKVYTRRSNICLLNHHQATITGSDES